jgi:hypothetical protein
MNLSGMDSFLWIAGIALEAVLLLVLLLRNRWRTFPIFTSFKAFLVLRSVALFMIYRSGDMRTYASAYWTGFGIDFVLQLGILYEIARIVLKPAGAWVKEARWLLIGFSLMGLFLAAVSSVIIHPSTQTDLQTWSIRTSLFTSLLTCELFLAVMFASNLLGLVWRNHVMALGQGLSLWALVGVAIDIMHSLGSLHFYTQLDRLRIITYVLVLLYWIFAFWRNEPEKRELTPEMKEYLVAIHQTVNYHLATVVSRKKIR